MTRAALFPALLAVLAPSAWSATPPSSGCLTSREYITALEFIRDQQDFKLDEKEAQKLASRVAEGCTGAAQRFVKVTLLLVRAGLGSKEAVQMGIDFSGRTDAEAETFAEVFQRSFLSDYLDLDLRSAIGLALSLSSQFEGDVLAVRNDYETLLDFCVKAKDLDLPRPQCGVFAAKLARTGQGWSGGIATPFLDAFRFLTSERGPGLATHQALRLAQELVEFGPSSPENFIQAYRYAVAPKGMSMPVQEAIAFARKMASRTSQSQPRGELHSKRD